MWDIKEQIISRDSLDQPVLSWINWVPLIGRNFSFLLGILARSWFAVNASL